MVLEIQFDLVSIIIATIGAITGIISLTWHILNSRSKVILEKVTFQRKKLGERVWIMYSFTVRNKSNRSTTIEEIDVYIGNRYMPYQFNTYKDILPNTSWIHHADLSFTEKEFEEILKKKPVKMGLIINHTFGTLKKQGHTNFKTDWLNLR